MVNNPAEFDKYEQEGAYHWRLTDESWTNSDYNPLMDARFAVIVRELQSVAAEGASVLDIGCGDGFLLAQVAKAYSDASLYGVDLEWEAVRIARQKLAREGVPVNVCQGSAYELPYAGDSFSGVLMTEVIEHLEAPGKALQEAHRVLEPGGHLLLTTPHRRPDFEWDPEYHVHEFTWPELSTLLAEHFDEVEGKAFLPMSWVNRWRQGVSMRVAIRAYSRLFENPLTQMAAEPSTQYGQIIALATKRA